MKKMNQRNDNRTYRGVVRRLPLLLAALALLAITAACSNQLTAPPPDDTPAPIPAQMGRALVSAGLDEAGGAWTKSLMPTTPAFTKYSLAFTAAEKTPVSVDLTASADLSTVTGGGYGVDLEPGTWNLTVTAYTGTAPGFLEAAVNPTPVSVAVTAGTSVAAPVTVEYIDIDPLKQGILSWSITFPTLGASDTAELKYKKTADSAYTTVNLKNLPASSDSLASGYYDVAISLTRGGKSVNRTEVAHIYPGLTTGVSFTFTDDSFATQVYLDGTLTITKPDSLTITSVLIKAYAQDAPTTIIGTTTSIPSSGGDWVMSVPVTALPADNPVYFKAEVNTGSVTCTWEAIGNTGTAVSDTGKGDNNLTLDTYFTSAAEMSAWLAAQPANTAATPYPAALSLDLGTDLAAGSDQLGALYAALQGKYVALDLSACTGNVPAASVSAVNNRPNKANLKSVVFPASLTSIGNLAFGSCGVLTSVNFSACTSPISIGYQAFYDCTTLTSMVFPASLTSIGGDAFRGCTGLTSVDLSACASLNSIDSQAFYGCTGLTSVDLSACASLTSIASHAFRGCTELTSVVFPASLTAIGSYAFNGCTGLESADLSACTSLTSISDGAFYSCTGLTSVTITKTSPPTIGSDVFGSVNAGFQIHVPFALVGTYQSAWSDYGPSGTNQIVAITDLKVKFGASTVTDAFTAVHDFIASTDGSTGAISAVIALGDYIDLDSLTVAAHNGEGAVSVPSNTELSGHGKLLRLIVVGINSFHSNGTYTVTDNDTTPHVVFQFQNVPGTRRMEATDTTANGYTGSEMKQYLVGNYLAGLTAAGVPNTVLWAPKRYARNGADTGTDEITELLWLPTERELFGSQTYSSTTYETAANQARLEYYTADALRIKYTISDSPQNYWLASCDSSSNFCNTGSNGGAYHNVAYNVVGCAPAFCVR
jgi:hypothetical protein